MLLAVHCYAPHSVACVVALALAVDVAVAVVAVVVVVAGVLSLRLSRFAHS